MHWLARVKLQTRLVAMVVAGSVLMIAFAVIGLHGMNSSNERLRTVYNDGLVTLGQFAGILERLIENQPLLRQALNQTTPEAVRAKTGRIEQNIEEIDRTWRNFAAVPRSAAEQQLADRWAADWRRYVSESLRPAVAALHAGDKAEVDRHLAQIVEVHVPALRNGTAALTRLQIDNARREYAAAVADYANLRNASLAALAVFIGAGGLFAFVTVRGIAGSARGLEQASGRLADGDLTVQADARGNDELAHIAGAFNRLAARLRQSLGEVSASTGQLAAAAEEMSAVSEQTRDGIGQQQSGTDQVAAAMHQMSATVQEVARNTVTAAEAARQADGLAKSGANEVRQTVGAIGNLAREVESAAQVIQKLSENSKGIGMVLDVIRGIAEQTNLLALNAAIEAARAGEQGRGFAVVADEVRTLASRTQKSTEEIQEMIHQLQAGATQAVDVMVRGRSQAQASVEQAARAGGSLDAIATAVSHITELNAQIASAAEEQSAVTEDISRNVVTISQIGTRTATGARQTAAASGELKALATQLHSLVGQFRL
ncbi:MAG: methyl-accepting chemotaxis protein [Chromatiales bacterium]|nr:methyl-accepting chemotaxis protein [Chromatiales bacterium]